MLTAIILILIIMVPTVIFGSIAVASSNTVPGPELVAPYIVPDFHKDAK